MEEIGIKLKEARENHGLDIPEVANDLNMRVSHIENIESGNIKAFNDIFYLKYFIREYAKYLGLDSEKLVDEFNEFLFDYTSKIPVEKIEMAAKEMEKKKEPKKIISPYTIKPKEKFKIPSKYIYAAIGILVIVILYILITMYGSDDFSEVNLVRSFI